MPCAIMRLLKCHGNSDNNRPKQNPEGLQKTKIAKRTLKKPRINTGIFDLARFPWYPRGKLAKDESCFFKKREGNVKEIVEG